MSSLRIVILGAERVGKSGKYIRQIYYYYSYNNDDNNEVLPGFFLEQGNKAIHFSGTREQESKTEGNRGEQRQFWGTGNIENQNFDFGEQEKMSIFSGEQRNRYPPPPLGGPQ